MQPMNDAELGRYFDASIPPSLLEPPGPVAPSLGLIFPPTGGGDRATPVTILGGGFVVGCIVVVDGTLSLPDIGLSGSGTIHVTLNLPVGDHSVSVRNPDGLESNALPWTAVTPLTLTSITPSTCTTTDGNVPVTLAGSGFRPSSTTLFMGTGDTQSAATYVSDTEMTSAIGGTFLGEGTHQVHLYNVEAGESNELPITVTLAAELDDEETS